MTLKNLQCSLVTRLSFSNLNQRQNQLLANHKTRQESMKKAFQRYWVSEGKDLHSTWTMRNGFRCTVTGVVNFPCALSDFFQTNILKC